MTQIVWGAFSRAATQLRGLLCKIPGCSWTVDDGHGRHRSNVPYYSLCVKPFLDRETSEVTTNTKHQFCSQ